MSITGSFGRLDAGTKFTGDGSGIKTTLPRSTGILTSSAQIAANISGSFNKGFEYEGIIKGASVTGNGTWSAGGALIQSHAQHGYAGSKTAGISAMGLTGPIATLNNAKWGDSSVERNEEYNGSTWSEANDNNTQRTTVAAAGTVNSAVFFGGMLPPTWYGVSSGATETYNGTNWSEVNDMIIPRRSHAGAGLSGDAAIAMGSYNDTTYNPSGNPSATPTMDCATEEWNGTNSVSYTHLTLPTILRV